MQKSFLEVQDEYERFKSQFPSDPTQLGEFAKQLDSVQGTQDRAEAYNDAWYKKANAFVDRGFRATGLPALGGAAAGAVGSGFDSLVGTNIEPTMRRLGEDLPRMTAEAVATIPAAAASGPVGPAAMWANRARQIAKVLGYGGSALGGYAQTESPMGAAISAGSLGLSNKLLVGPNSVGQKAAGALRDRLGLPAGELPVPGAGADLSAPLPSLTHSSDALKNRLVFGANVGTEMGTQLGINEATRQAQLSVGPNAVGITDPARNPLTPENAATNVAGLLPFAAHFALGVRNPTGLDMRQARPLIAELKSRYEATVKSATEPSDMRTAIDAPGGFSEKDTHTAVESVVAHLSAARGADLEGLTEDASRRRSEAANILRRLGKTEADLPTAQQDMKEVRVQADTGLAMASPEALSDFVRKVNGVIDFWNENRAKLESGEITPKQVTAERTAEQSFHPEARSTVVTERLQEKGLLPKITYDWLKSERYVTEEQLGSTDHAFVNDVLAQKVANRLLDSVPEALKKEATLPTGAVVQPKNVVEGQQKADDLYLRLTTAIGKFPLEYQNALAERSVDLIRKHGVEYSRPGRLNQTGTPAHYLPHWVKALEQAGETYNPVDQTIQLYRDKRENVGVLWGAKGAGEEFTPGMTYLTTAEGGKVRHTKEGTKYIEGNVEGMGLLEEMAAEPSDEAAKGYNKFLDENLDALHRNTSSLTNEQAWNLIRDPIFGRGRSMASDFHETNAKLIVEALPDFMKKKGEEVSPAGKALVAAWEATGKKMPGTELAKLQNTFFAILKSHMGFADAPDLGRKEVAVRRAGEIVQKLLDPKAVEVAKGWKGPLAMAAQGQEGETPLVAFSAPRRLRELLAGPSGGLTPDSMKQVPSQSVKNFLTNKGVTKAEMSIYEAAGLDKMLSAKKVPVEALAKWMEEKTTRVEVIKDSAEEKITPERREYDILRHEWYDRLSVRQQEALILLHDEEQYGNKITQNNKYILDSLSSDDLAKAKRFDELDPIVSAQIPSTSNRIPFFPDIAPKSLKDMPGAVVILVRVPQTVERGEALKYPDKPGSVTGKDEKGGFRREAPLFTGHHFGSHDVNVLASVRGYEETLPDGRKVFHVFEVQSDWGQSFAKNLRKGEVDETAPQGWQSTGTTKNHPLLPVYEQLALKAAIAHAREIGADFVALSDAETAMMTEGHDREANQVANFLPTPHNVELAKQLEATRKPVSNGVPRSLIIELSRGQSHPVNREMVNKARELGFHIDDVRPPQEPGMRAAYDSRLPKTMEKLTGAAGEPMEFGTHEKAIQQRRDTLEVTGSPVFKDIAGNPKTQVTARLYPISAAPSEFSAFGYSKPMAAQVEGGKNLPADIQYIISSLQAGSDRAPTLIEREKLLPYINNSTTRAKTLFRVSPESGRVFTPGEVIDFPVVSATREDVTKSGGVGLKTGDEVVYEIVNPKRGLDLGGFEGESLISGKYKIIDSSLVNVEGVGEHTRVRLEEMGGEEKEFSGTPGAFAPDVLRTISSAVDRHFGTKGYSGDMRTMMHAAAMAIVQSMKDVPTDFYKLGDKASFGLANEVAGRGKVGLGVEPIAMEDSTHFVHRVLTTLTHELAHIDDFVHFGGLRNTDAYSEERARQLLNVRSMFNATDGNQHRAILTTLDEGLTPPSFRSSLRENPAQMEKAVANVDEFSASVMALVTQSLLFGKTKGLKTALETLDYSPIEVQEYGQYQYRAIRDVLQSMQDTLADPSIRASVAKASIATGDPFILSKAFSAVVETAMQASRVRDGTKMVAEAREMVKNMVPGAGMQEPMTETDAVWSRRQKDIESTHGTEAFMQGPYAMARATEAVDIAREALGIVKGKSTKLGVWSNWFAPFANVMDEMRRRGVELARPVADLLGDTESAMRRLHSDIMAPLLKHEKDGTVNYDGEHTFVRGMKDSRPQVKLGFNEVSRWQEAHAGKPMFNEVNGELVPITEARSEWEKMRKKYSLADQQVIVAGSVAWDKIGQNEAGTVLSTLKESAQLRVSGLLMGKDRTMGFYPAKASGQQIVEAYLTNNRAALAAIPPQLLRSIDTIMSGPEGFVENFFALKQKFDAAPGWRTTQLPGDWVVMYTKAGETKFASAPSEEQAKYVRNRVVQQGGTPIGEIVNRKDMRGKYAEFDDPDTVLLKFSKVEGKAWERVVEDIRKTEGDAVADNVASMYTPGAESLSDIEKRSFRRYMIEKKGQVDLENLDFLDAGLARVSRLAASVAFKLHGQTKDLLLNDPSVRDNIDFKARVNKQWDHITSPTGEMTQKMKAMGSAYYMGLNLSSMAFEGTQSVSTVVPMLIATNKGGGPVKAYNQLRQALADTFTVTHSEDWKRIGKAAFDKQEAARREGTVADLTPEEEKFGGYYRAVQNGDIGHGYIGDMGYSRGAKAQELAKFGQGDYGPTPWTKVVTNGMYNAAQAMLGFYGVVSKYNDKIAFFAGLNQGIEQAMTGDELYYHTKNFKTMTTFGGGKANAIGAVQAKDPHIRSALGLAATLQTYGLGMVATYMKFVKESINADGSLSPQERRQAIKAFSTMLATQVATAGVLGVPFAAAAMTMIEKATGQPINQMVRQGIADLTDSPEWTEGILNGIGNQMFGLDISSRIGTSTILGTSAYRGFSLQDMLGPFPSIAQNMVKGLNYFGQNEPLRAARELVPQAFKTGFALADSHAKYGDYAIRDGQENLVYTPTAGQNIARALGFRSREESLKRSASSMMHEADVRSLQTTDQARDDVARRLLSGDPQSARLYAQNMRSADPTVDIRDVLRGVMEKAVGMTQERDLLASGPRGNAAERQSIVASFGPGANTRQSEVGAMRLRTQLAAQLGMPDLMPSGKAWTRAAVVDAIVQRTGVARSQALATVEAMGM